MNDVSASHVVPRRVDGVLAVELPDELLLHVPGGSMATTLNTTARAVWELCDGRRSVEVIARDLAQRFDAAPGEILVAVRDVVRDLTRLELLVLPPPPDAPHVGS
jgi:hypothetical protein